MSKLEVDEVVDEQEAVSTDEVLEMLPSIRAKGFIMKLYSMLNMEEHPDIVHWTIDGKGFIIVDRDKFISEVLPKYFRGVKMTSFVRQLCMYSFTKEEGTGLYTHPFFIKNKSNLLKLISRRNKISKKKNRAPDIDSKSDDTEVDDKVLPPLKKIKKSYEQMKESNDVRTKFLQVMVPFSEPNVSSMVTPPSFQGKRWGSNSVVGICQRCAQIEHLLVPEEPFKDVFDENVKVKDEQSSFHLTEQEELLADTIPSNLSNEDTEFFETLPSTDS